MSEQRSTTIDLLRHGETRAGKCFLGSTDALLNTTGWQQMEQARLQTTYDRVISSPLRRCQDFAQQFATQQAIPLQLESELREIDFGEWEGRFAEQLWEENPQALGAFWQDPFSHTPPGGETMTAFVERVRRGFAGLQQQCEGENVLLVCHAGVIKLILSDVLGMDASQLHRLTIDHGGLSRINCWQDSLHVAFVNR